MMRISRLVPAGLIGAGLLGFLIWPTDPQSVPEGPVHVPVTSPEKSTGSITSARVPLLPDLEIVPADIASPAEVLARSISYQFGPGRRPSPQDVIDIAAFAIEELLERGPAGGTPSSWSAIGVSDSGNSTSTSPWGSGDEYRLQFTFPVTDLRNWPLSQSAALVVALDGLSGSRPPDFVSAWIETEPLPGRVYGEREVVSSAVRLDIEAGWLRYIDILRSGSSESWQETQRSRSPQAEIFNGTLSGLNLSSVEMLAKAYAKQN